MISSGSDLPSRERLKSQLRRSWDFILQEFVEQRVTLVESSPCGRQVEHGSTGGASQNGSAEEYLCAQSRGLSIAAHARSALELAQQVEEHQNAQESGLGGEELAQAKIIRRQVRLQLLDALFDTGALVVVAPDLLGRLRPVGHEHPKGVAGNFQQLPPQRALRLAQFLPHHHKASLPIPSQELPPELSHRVSLVERPPGLHPRRLPLQPLRQPGHHDVVQLQTLQVLQQLLREEPRSEER